MRKIEFVIPVHPVSKKNSQVIIPVKTKYGKTRHIPIPSPQYRDFEAAVMPFLMRVKSETGVIDYPNNMAVEFYVSKKLKYDLTNLLEAIDDAAVKSGLIADDNRDIIAGHDGSRVFYDKINPRIEITITKMDDYIQWKPTNITQKGLFE
jgi:Holliday junction resolvase RusA-like endonuclease